MGLIFIHTLKGHRIVLLLMALALIGFGILIATSFQTFRGAAASAAFVQEMPKGVSALLKTEGNLLLASGAQGYLGIGFRHPLVLIIVSALAIATASGAIAREIERKTILLLLSRPIPRYKLVLGKMAESSLGGVVLVISLLVGILSGVAIAHLWSEITLGPIFVMGFNTLCLYLVILGYSFLISSLSNDGGRAIMLPTALTVAFFFIDFMASLFDVLKPLGYISIFHYYDPTAIATQGTFPILSVGVLLSVALVATAGSIIAFQRRDIAA
ncbi:MAG: ABC transporter permease subunit [Chloroflexi bacterium]|nr:ABC transporter permease subunit [Chloroflexota bacterium]